MQQYQFIIPEKRDSDKLPHTSEEWSRLADSLFAVADGFITDYVLGYWRDDSGEIVGDSSRRYTVAVGEWLIVGGICSGLKAIVRDACETFDQQCIYFVHPDGTAELIYP